MNIKKLHEAYRTIEGIQRSQDNVIKEFSAAFSPDTYPLFHSQGIMEGFMLTLRAIDPALAEEYSYYTYEVPFFRDKKKTCIVTKDGKEWNFCDEKQFLAYLSEYYLTK